MNEPSPLDHWVVPHESQRRCHLAQVTVSSRFDASGQPWPWHVGHAGSTMIAFSGHLSTQTAQSSHVYGSMANSPRNVSVLCSASAWHEKSHAPQPMHSDSMTRKLIAPTTR